MGRVRLRTVWVWAAVALVPVAGARGEDGGAPALVATRSGVMCASADALARLVLPNGSSRAAAPGARPEDAATRRAGDCVDVAPGTRVALREGRKQTSIVLFDAGDGKGVRPFVAANIDFGPAGAGAGAAAGEGACYGYGVPVRLSGRVTMGSAYGEDLHTGRMGTSRWLQVTLDRPLCTRASPATYEEAERNVRAVQPVWLGQGPDPFTEGRRVSVEGTLVHQDNGMQKTRVLLEAMRVTTAP